MKIILKDIGSDEVCTAEIVDSEIVIYLDDDQYFTLIHGPEVEQQLLHYLICQSAAEALFDSDLPKVELSTILAMLLYAQLHEDDDRLFAKKEQDA